MAHSPGGCVHLANFWEAHAMSKLRLASVIFSVACLMLLGSTRAVQAQTADPLKERLDSSPRHHEWVDVESTGGRKVKCFVVFPEVSEKATAVLVIHENKGLTDWVRLVADRVAEGGFVAVAPDFLSGMGPDGGNTESFASVDAATKGIYGLKDPQVMGDLDAAAAYAKKLDAASGKIVTVGFCWGGGKSFAYATHNPELTAAIVFYGTAPEDAALAKIKAPVYGFYGGNDNRITGQVPRVAAAMKKLGKTFEPTVYEGAGHGFMRTGMQTDASEADRQAYEQARERVKKILAEF
jgi:carboxymethylenebutenolidase